MNVHVRTKQAATGPKPGCCTRPVRPIKPVPPRPIRVVR